MQLLYPVLCIVALATPSIMYPLQPPHPVISASSNCRTLYYVPHSSYSYILGATVGSVIFDMKRLKNNWVGIVLLPWGVRMSCCARSASKHYLRGKWVSNKRCLTSSCVSHHQDSHLQAFSLMRDTYQFDQRPIGRLPRPRRTPRSNRPCAMQKSTIQ